MRLIYMNEKDKKRRRDFSDFRLCVDEAVVFNNPAPLAEWLRSDRTLTQVDRNLLADLAEGKIKRGRGRPGGKPMFRLDWLADSAVKFESILARWKRMRNGRTKFDPRGNGNRVSVRDEICERLAARCGHEDEAGMLIDYLDRPKKRR